MASGVMGVEALEELWARVKALVASRAAKGDEGWTDVLEAEGAHVKCCRRAGMVTMRVQIGLAGYVTDEWTPVTTLPAECRPATAADFAGITADGAPVHVYVGADGRVQAKAQAAASSLYALASWPEGL